MAEEKKDAPKVKRPTAQKRDLQNEKKRLHNKSYRAAVTTAIRSLQTSIESKDQAALKDKLSSVYSMVDKGVKTGIFKLNKASRIKARLTKKTQSITA